MAVTVPTFRKICQHCGKEFIACYQRTEYCSARCAKLADKQRKRNERLKETQLEVRERERLALLDKNWLTLSDAARLMQMSRTTLYKVIADHGIELKRFSARTVRIARADLEKVTYNRETQLYKTAKEQSDDLGRWMTREQVMEKYDVTYSWFYSVLKKRGIKSRIIGSLGFYDKEEMHRIDFVRKMPSLDLSGFQYHFRTASQAGVSMLVSVLQTNIFHGYQCPCLIQRIMIFDCTCHTYKSSPEARLYPLS